jgi:hypothetical protein
MFLWQAEGLKEASQTRDYCVAKDPSALLRAGCDTSRSSQILRETKGVSLRMTKPNARLLCRKEPFGFAQGRLRHIARLAQIPSASSGQALRETKGVSLRMTRPKRAIIVS